MMVTMLTGMKTHVQVRVLPGIAFRWCLQILLSNEYFLEKAEARVQQVICANHSAVIDTLGLLVQV